MASADFVLRNATIYTVDDERPQASALAVRNGRFVDVAQSVARLDVPLDTQSIDAEGHTVVPGFIDAHAHLQELGLSLHQVNLTDATSPAAVVDQLEAFVARHDLPDGVWLRGHGWDQTDWSPPHLPSRTRLDAAFPERPVWLTRTDVHAGWANTAALKTTVGLDRLQSMSDSEGGRIHRNSSGQPTGVLVDRAMTLVEDQIPPPSDVHLDRALTTALRHSAHHGLTGLHDAGVGLDTIHRYQRFIEDDAFPLRLYAMVDGRGEAFDHFCERGPHRHSSGRLRVESVKFFADGALGSRGAALLADYTDDPGNRGFLFHTPGQLQKHVHDAVECGFQVNTHAIGDRANRVVLDAYEAALENAERSMRRPRIEHTQIVHPDDRSRFGTLGVIASTQPGFATSDMNWASDRIGPPRMDRAYAWQSLQSAGAHLAFGSDAPVEPIDPLRGFHAAVTRQDANGHPNGGWHPSERVSRPAALHAYTHGAAYAACMENEVGSITQGKRADFVVLSQDIMQVSSSQLLDTEVLATYLDGTTTYTAEDWPDA